MIGIGHALRYTSSLVTRATALSRELSLMPRIMAARVRHGRPDWIISYHGGIGDDMMCTVLCHELRRRGAGRIWMLSKYADLFAHNEDVDAVLPWSRAYVLSLRKMGWWRIPNPRYNRYDRPTDSAVLIEPARHIVTTMCKMVGIVGPIVRRPHVTLLDAERAAGTRVPRQVVIQSSGLEAGTPMLNKQWPAERFNAVVGALRDEFDFVQLGAPSDPPLDGVLDLRGRTTRRESAAILSRSLAFIGNVGFLMHLARAVECRSVIVYGGRERPDQSGYGCNENLYGDVPCAPCWQRNRCDYGRRCLDGIVPADVIDALRRVVARHGTPLEEDHDVVEASPFVGVGASGRPVMSVVTPFGPRRLDAAILGEVAIPPRPQRWHSDRPAA